MTSQPLSVHYQRMEEWLEDRKPVLSRKDQKTYSSLLALAPRMVQTAQYDIPALERTIKKCETAVEECHRVVEEAARMQVKLRDQRSAMLRDYGMELMNDEADAIHHAVDTSVRTACAEANAAFQTFARSRVGLLKDEYNEFLNACASGFYAADAFAQHFPWLQRALEEKILPLTDTSSGGQAAPDDESEEAAEPHIDWGEDVGAAPPEMAVDGSVVQIHWDATDMPTRSSEDDALPLSDKKHFSINLSCSKHRGQVMGELQAASCFSRERGSSELVEVAADADALRARLSHSRVGELLCMKESFRARDAFVNRIEHFAQLSKAAENRSRNHQAKICDAENELAKLKPQQAALLARLRSLRDEAVSLLQHMFPDRKILIVGDLNKYLS